MIQTDSGNKLDDIQKSIMLSSAPKFQYWETKMPWEMFKSDVNTLHSCNFDLHSRIKISINTSPLVNSKTRLKFIKVIITKCCNSGSKPSSNWLFDAQLQRYITGCLPLQLFNLQGARIRDANGNGSRVWHPFCSTEWKNYEASQMNFHLMHLLTLCLCPIAIK